MNDQAAPTELDRLILEARLEYTRQGDDLQSKLTAHFADLRSRRPLPRPIFALEHDLDLADLSLIRDIVGVESAFTSLRSKHWLLWVVHATEIAYTYAGDEYWQSFGAQTTGWTDGNRSWFRTTFERFAAIGGPTPTGSWARSFTNICWPITNAVLPTDLQRHLARALYSARYGLAESATNLGDLGRHIAASSWQGSDRFTQLREQPELLGQIGLALLRPHAVSDELLSTRTLQRIAADLEAERASAAWLRSARRSLEDASFRLKGATRPGVARTRSDFDLAGVRAKFSAPEIALMQRAAGWRPWVRLPNLSAVASVSMEIRRALLESRSWVPSSDTPVPPSALLFDGQQVPMDRWPRDGESLVRFQGLAQGLETALLSAWAMPRGPMLFRVGDDLVATFMATNVVRPGTTYLLASASPIAKLAAASVNALIPVHIYALTIPRAVTTELASLLRDVGLISEMRTEISPAGAYPLLWDTESRAQWLTGDQSILGVSSDHDLALLEFTFSGLGRVLRTDVRAGTEVFLAVPELPAGSYTLVVRETPRGGQASSRVIQWQIREPQAVSPDGAGPVRMWTEPFSRNLEHVWDGSCSIHLAGPTSRAVLHVSLASKMAVLPLVQKSIELRLPMTGQDWNTLMRSEVVDDPRLGLAYDDARIGIFEFDVGAFGRYTLEFERSIPPLRWRIESGGGHLRIVDDTDAVLPPEVTFASFDDPLVFKRREVRPDTRVSADVTGGLFYAASGAHRAAIVTGPRDRVLRGFEELEIRPRVPELGRQAGPIAECALVLARWAWAPLPGNPIVRRWRASVLAALHNEIAAAIGGTRWEEAELAYVRTGGDEARGALAAALGSRHDLAALEVRRIVDGASQLGQLGPTARIDGLEAVISAARFDNLGWAAVAQANGLETRRWVAEFIFRAATDPGFAGWAGASLNAGLALVLGWSFPFRLARYVALSSIADEDLPEQVRPTYQSMRW